MIKLLTVLSLPAPYVWRVSVAIQKYVHVSKWWLSLTYFGLFAVLASLCMGVPGAAGVLLWAYVGRAELAYVWRAAKADQPDPSGVMPKEYAFLWATGATFVAITFLLAGLFVGFALQGRATVFTLGDVVAHVLFVAGAFTAVGPGVPPSERITLFAPAQEIA